MASLATTCRVPRMSQLRTMVRSSLSARFTSLARRLVLGTRIPSAAALRTCACSPTTWRRIVAGRVLVAVSAVRRCAAARIDSAALSDRTLAAGGSCLDARLGHPRGIQQAVELGRRKFRPLASDLTDGLATGQRLLCDLRGGGIADGPREGGGEHQSLFDHLRPAIGRLDSFDALLAQVLGGGRQQ